MPSSSWRWQTATGPRAGRLPQLKAEIKSAGDALAEVSTFVTDKGADPREPEKSVVG